MPRPFLQWPDPRLKTICPAVTGVNAEVKSIWDDMLEAMYAMPGVGLAAPQLGEMMRLAVVDCSGDASGAQAVRLANPEIASASVEFQLQEEGSPCLPGQYAKISRPEWVDVRYLDDTGAETTRRFEGLWSTSVQHQIDHLNGRMFFHRLSPMKRNMLLKKHSKASQRPKGS